MSGRIEVIVELLVGLVQGRLLLKIADEREINRVGGARMRAIEIKRKRDGRPNFTARWSARLADFCPTPRMLEACSVIKVVHR